jgi:hypothetical protein
VTLAHVGGVPLEEWVLSVVVAGGGLAAYLRARLDRGTRPDRPAHLTPGRGIVARRRA